jgi:hypothetical protein
LTEAVPAPNEIILTTRQQVLDFLKTRPDPDEVISWTCPECAAVNIGTYHSHVARCGSCGRGHFPAIPCPIVGDAKTSVRRAFANDRLSQIERNIEDAKQEIRNLESQMDDNEQYIRELKKERNDIRYALHLDLVRKGDV